MKEKIFTCTKCGNNTLVQMEQNQNALGIDYHDLFICEECGAELLAEPQFDGNVKFVDAEEESC